MAEQRSDKGRSASGHCDAAPDVPGAASTVGVGAGAIRGEEEKLAVQKALEDALLAAGLGDLTLSGEGDGEAREERVMVENEGRGERSEQSGTADLSPPAVSVDSASVSEHGRGGSPGGEERGNSCCLNMTGSEVGEEGGGEEAEMEIGRTVEGATVVEWTVITDTFTQAAALLAPGELIQEWNFNLLDAMSAVELLDPKMDASMHWTSFKGYPRTVSEAIARGLLQLEGHTPAQVIGIFDEILACIATWLGGHTLAQTVFSCMYLLETDRVEALHLRSFSMAVVKVVEYMREYICRGGVFFEDDQQGMCFGFNMLTAVDDAIISAALKESEEKTSTVARQSFQADRQREESKKKTVSKETECLRAIVTRIRFIRNLFGLMSVLRKRPVGVIQPVLDHLTQCLSLLEDIMTSCPLGEKLDPHDPLKLGFHPLINHNLLPPSYRQCEIVPRQEALSSLQTVLQQVEAVLRFGKLESFKALKAMSKEFCSREPAPNVLARSVMVLVCIQSDRTKIFGSPSLEEMLKRDARDFSNPPSLNPRSPHSSSSQGKELTERFFGRAIHPMSELLRVYCQPRARQQEKAERVLDFLADLQHETERIDHLQNEVAMKTDPQRQHRACYASWVINHLLHLMIDYVVLGFEYSLYSPFEFHYVYWYLEYLYGWLHTTWKTADHLNSEPSVAAGKGSKKKGKKGRRETAEKREREVAIVHVKRLVSVGMMRAFEALILEEKVPFPPFEYGSQSLCFLHRFAAFASIVTPQLLTYEDYIQLAGLHNYRGQDINLYEAASRHFSSAKATIEALSHPSDELQGLLKVVKMNIVLMNISANGHNKASKTMPVLDFSLHKHFPVIRIR